LRVLRTRKHLKFGHFSPLAEQLLEGIKKISIHPISPCQKSQVKV
jgi:hypothetical protein